MAQIGWFFAGTSFGLFAGVLLVCLTRIASASQEQEFAQPAAPSQVDPQIVVMPRSLP